MCAECETAAEKCISCPTDFEQRGSDCLNSKRISLQLVLQPTMEGWNDAKTPGRQHQLILSKWSELQTYVQGLTGSQSMANIHVTGYSFGSLVFGAVVSPPPGSSAEELYNAMKANLNANPSSASYNQVSSSMSPEGFTPEGESRVNLGLVLGISVPTVILRTYSSTQSPSS